MPALLSRCLVLVLLSAAILAAQSAPRLRLVDGTTLSGEIRAFADGRLRIDDGADGRDLPLKRLVDIDFGRELQPPAFADAQLLRFELAGGDLLFGKVIDGDFDMVRIDSAAAGVVELPLDWLRRALVPANIGAGLDADELRPREGEDRDLLFLSSRGAVDRVVGEVERFRPGALHFVWNELGASEFEFGRNGVLAVCLAPADVLKNVDDLQIVVDFRDTGRLTCRLLGVGKGELQVEALGGRRLGLAMDRILRISVRGGDFIGLSDLEAKALRETPYIEGGVTWGLRRDRGLGGGRIVVGGRYFSRALAVHSGTEVDFAVPKGVAWFDCSVGIDDAVLERPIKGAVTFSLRSGDRVLAGPLVMRGGEAPGRFERVDLRGVETLTLVAGFADRHHFNGWAIFGDPMFIRGE